MFDHATSFNQPIGSWDVSNPAYFQLMFDAADAFNQPLDSWEMSNAWNMHVRHIKRYGRPNIYLFPTYLHNSHLFSVGLADVWQQCFQFSARLVGRQWWQILFINV